MVIALTSRALVMLDPAMCPDCGAPLRLHVAEQQTLLRHGGYGANVRTVTRRCPKCGWQLEHLRTEVSPKVVRDAGDGADATT